MHVMILNVDVIMSLAVDANRRKSRDLMTPTQFRILRAVDLTLHTPSSTGACTD